MFDEKVFRPDSTFDANLCPFETLNDESDNIFHMKISANNKCSAILQFTIQFCFARFYTNDNNQHNIYECIIIILTKSNEISQQTSFKVFFGLFETQKRMFQNLMCMSKIIIFYTFGIL